VTLLLVLVCHVGVIALLMMTEPGVSASEAPSRPLELLPLQPALVPRIRSEEAVPRRQVAPYVPRVTLPVIDAAPLGRMAPDAPAADGRGAGVDWAAEARRALNAFEIRHHERPPSNVSVAGEPGNDYWLRQLHHAGDQLKTGNGDWIIWTNADCYQIARADPITAEPVTASAEVTCVPAIAEHRRDDTLRR
jgi:hypothetical protein